MVLTAARPERRSAGLQDRLDLLTIQSEALLETIRGGSLLDARRAVTRELHFEPRAEELQAIVWMAENEADRGPAFDLPRRMLSMRILIERTVKHVHEAKNLVASEMRGSAVLLGELICEVRALDEALEKAAEPGALPPGERDDLLKIGGTFAQSVTHLAANAVLAHRLADLAEYVENDELGDLEPDLTPRERDCIAAFVAENITPESTRVAVDAIAVRTHAGHLAAAFGEMGPPSEDDTAQRAHRDELLARIEDAMAAIDAVSERIQRQQDEAVVAKIESLAEELREAGRGLFSTKLQLAPILRAPYEDRECNDTPADGAPALRDLLAESAAEEQGEAAGPRQESEDEIYVNALKDMRSRKERRTEEFRKKQKLSDAQRQRRRMAVMISLAGVLAITSAIVNFVILPSPSGEPAPPTSQEMRPVIKAKRVEHAGPVMFTHVDDWNGLEAGERASKVGAAGELAAEGGIQMMFVIDEYGDVAAAWDRSSGAAVVEAPE